jgi:hypothetical protein
VYGVETGNFGKLQRKLARFGNGKVRVYWEILMGMETWEIAFGGNFKGFFGALKFP